GLIARRRAIDHLRRQGRKPDFEPLSAAGSIPLPALEKSSVLLDSETVKSSLASFPADTRQLFDLFFEEGFTHPEIAAKTGLPLGTVKTRLRRGLILLREQLQRIATPNQNPAS
ncbi:MAG: sigma factor-like helix-turn-helix DNA-binding protein, partial [Luteolibacter sp.]